MGISRITVPDAFVRWVVFPFLYSVSVLLVFIGSLYVVSRVEAVRGCGWDCEVGGLLAMLVFGALIFSLSSIGLVRLERLQRLSLLDHLRHGMVLYLLMVVLGCVLLASYDTQGSGLAWRLGIFLFLSATYANLLDVLVVYVAKRLRQ